MLRDFLRTVGSYSLVEKAVSLGLVFLFLFSSWMGLFGGQDASADDTYVEGSSGKIMVLNPLFSNYSDNDRDVASLIFSGLMKYDAEKGKMVEDLATLKLNADQTSYTFTIKDSAVFHNGDPVTADDVYYTYHDVVQSPDFSNAVLTANFNGVQVTKKAPKVIEFKLDQPNSFFITNLSVGILPMNVYKDVPVGDFLTSDINKTPVGSGPYQVESAYTANSRGDGKITLTRFEKYYGGLPRIKTIVYRTFTNPDRLLDAQGELNAISKIETASAGELKSKFSKTGYMLPQYKAAFFNMDSLIVGNKSVRLALLKSVDKTKLLATMPGRTPVDTPFMELNQTDWVYKPDLDEAKGALFDAGYRYPEGQKEGFRKTKKGNPMKITLAYFAKDEKSKGENEDVQIAEFLKESWEGIGVEVEIVPVSPDDRTAYLQAREYDVLLAGESLGYDLDTYFFWHSSQATADGSNLSNYKNFTADAIIEDIRRFLDDERKEKRLKQLAKIVKDDIPALFLFRPEYIYANDGKVTGMKLSKVAFPADRFYNVQTWTPAP